MPPEFSRTAVGSFSVDSVGQTFAVLYGEQEIFDDDGETTRTVPEGFWEGKVKYRSSRGANWDADEQVFQHIDNPTGEAEAAVLQFPGPGQDGKFDVDFVLATDAYPKAADVGVAASVGGGTGRLLRSRGSVVAKSSQGGEAKSQVRPHPSLHLFVCMSHIRGSRSGVGGFCFFGEVRKPAWDRVEK